MNLRILFIIHAIVTLAAAVALVVAPQLIPETVDIAISKSQYLLCYLLGAVEFGIAFLSFYATKITDVKSLRIICLAFIAMHMATALVEVYAIAEGASVKLWANVALRIVVSVLFWYYGMRKKSVT